MTDGSVGKALRVLEALADHSRVTDLAAATALPKSTVHRLLRELVDAGFASADDRGEYRTGARVMQLAGNVLHRVGPVALATPMLARLCADTACTVHFALRFDAELLYVHKVEPDKPYRMGSRIGMALAWHSSAIGKAVLAALPGAQLNAVLGGITLHPNTPHSLTSRDELHRQLDEIRRRGYALDDGENEIGVRCVGAAVHDHTGTVLGGVSVSTLSLEHTMRRLGLLGPRVLAAAAAVSAALGHVSPGAAPPPSPPPR